ncbi:hypothetical protein [Streptomyces sp. NPDC087317]|uniref:hypothetical protein n=1 Tax=Streptomyces sp. NPDC087317 TaxID=3365784 RepID=UPI003821945E
MSTLSTVVASVEKLTREVRRIADTLPAPVAIGEMTTVGTCDASTTGLGAATLGPCILRHQHNGPIHQDETGVRWSTADDDAATPATTCSAQYTGMLPVGECIRAAGHIPVTDHTDDRGRSWGDNLAVYPITDASGCTEQCPAAPGTADEETTARADWGDAYRAVLSDQVASLEMFRRLTKPMQPDTTPSAVDVSPGVVVITVATRQTPETPTDGHPPMDPVRIRGVEAPAADGTCRSVEVDGEPVHVRGSGDFTEQDAHFFGEVVRAAKRKYEGEHVPAADGAGQPITDRPLGERLATVHNALARVRALLPDDPTDDELAAGIRPARLRTALTGTTESKEL